MQDGEVLSVINEALRRCEAIDFSLEETALLARLIVDVAGKAVCRSSLLVPHAAFVGYDAACCVPILHLTENTGLSRWSCGGGTPLRSAIR